GPNNTVAAPTSAGNGRTSSPTAPMTITAANHPPPAPADAASTDEDQATQVNVRGNDTDPDAADTLTVSAVNTTGTSGTVTITNGGADVRYDPGSAFHSLSGGQSATDTFAYTASDGHGGSDTATVTVTVTGANDAPVAFDDTAAANEDAPVSIDVLANDVDIDVADTLTITGTGGSPQGSVSVV